MANFAVRLVHGPGWDPTRQIRDQDGWDQHAAFMDGLVDDGFVILGGPVGNGEQTLHVIEAADENSDSSASRMLSRAWLVSMCSCDWLLRASADLPAGHVECAGPLR